MQSLRHIVVGTDFSPCAESAVEAAVILATASLARITLVHVCELTAELGSASSSALDEDLLRECNQQLATLVAGHSNRGVEVKGLLRTGKPWEKLNNAATEVGANLIVIGRVGRSHGWTDASRRESIGTVAKHLLRCTGRPVLTVPLADITAPHAEAV